MRDEFSLDAFPLSVKKQILEGALKAGYVSITPLQLDLTAREALRNLRKWEW